MRGLTLSLLSLLLFLLPLFLFIPHQLPLFSLSPDESHTVFYSFGYSLMVSLTHIAGINLGKERGMSVRKKKQREAPIRYLVKEWLHQIEMLIQPEYLQQMNSILIFPTISCATSSGTSL